MVDEPSLGGCPVGPADVTALIGVCAVLEGHLMGGRDRLADLSRHLGDRLTDDGLMVAGGDERAVRQAINDVNQRLRYAQGEYPEPPASMPVPA